MIQLCDVASVTMKGWRGGAFLLALGFPYAAVAQSSTLASIETVIGPLMRSYTLSAAAQQCGLRSSLWFRTMSMGIETQLRETEGVGGLTPADRNALDQFKMKTYDRAMHSVTCSTLTNSATMDELDKLQRQMSGGYH